VAEQLTLEQAMERANNMAVKAWSGQEDDGSSIAQGRREWFTQLATAYATLALALQEERRWQEEQIQRITTKATSGAEVEGSSSPPY
jgi:hypothetical protein